MTCMTNAKSSENHSVTTTEMCTMMPCLMSESRIMGLYRTGGE